MPWGLTRFAYSPEPVAKTCLTDRPKKPPSLSPPGWRATGGFCSWPTAKARPFAAFHSTLPGPSAPSRARRISTTGSRYSRSATWTVRARPRGSSIPWASRTRQGGCTSPTATTTKSKSSTRRPAWSETVLGTGKRGTVSIRRNSPSRADLSIAGGKLYIADTNNQVIKVADTSGRNVRVLRDRRSHAAKEPRADAGRIRVEGNRQGLVADGASGGRRRVAVRVRVPSPRRLQAQQGSSDYLPTACGRADRARRGEPAQQASRRHARGQRATRRTSRFPPRSSRATPSSRWCISFTYCRGGVSGLCKLGSEHWTVPIDVAESGGESSIPLTAQVR